MTHMKHTSWTEATENPWAALVALVSCIHSGKNCWIEMQKNGEQDFPVMVPNPALDDPFNWTMNYGTPGAPNEDTKYLNETQKDLTFNWTACFGEERAVEKYKRTGKLTHKAIKGMGVCFPCRKADFLKLRTDLKGWTFENLWTTYWEPKDKMPYRVPKRIDRVFVVCFDDKPADSKLSLMRASAFLSEVAHS